MMKLPKMLDYEIVVTKPGSTVWFMFHGWTDRNDFPDICKIHEHVPAVYIKAPRWWCGGGGWLPHFGSWDAKLAEPVIATIEHVIQYDLPEAMNIVLAGNSDGATFVHHYAKHWGAQGIRYIAAIVHYAGLWKGVKADVPAPAFFFLGKDEAHFKIRDQTYYAAVEYGAQVHELSGGHRWNPDENKRIIDIVNQNEIRDKRTV